MRSLAVGASALLVSGCTLLVSLDGLTGGYFVMSYGTWSGDLGGSLTAADAKRRPVGHGGLDLRRSVHDQHGLGHWDERGRRGSRLSWQAG